MHLCTYFRATLFIFIASIFSCAKLKLYLLKKLLISLVCVVYMSFYLKTSEIKSKKTKHYVNKIYTSDRLLEWFYACLFLTIVKYPNILVECSGCVLTRNYMMTFKLR
jgi:hypothetical protein